MAAAAASKAKSIEIAVTETNFGYEDGAPDSSVWPEGSSNKNLHENEEDLYGYGYAAPGIGTHTKYDRMPRRSSLKNPNTCARRASIGFTGEMNLVLPAGKTAQRKTSITFAERDNVEDIESAASMVDTPRRLWFQEEEYAHINEKVQKIVEESKKKKGVETRGLENLLDDSGVLDRREARDGVFDEQSMQKSRGTYNDDNIKTIYQFHSIDAQVRANDRASNDSKDVEAYLKVTRKMCRRMSC
jgi:hypothetical protein